VLVPALALAYGVPATDALAFSLAVQAAALGTSLAIGAAALAWLWPGLVLRRRRAAEGAEGAEAAEKLSEALAGEARG